MRRDTVDIGRRIRLAILPVAFLITLALVGTSLAESGYPRPLGYVSDYAGMLSPQAEAIISAIAAEVKAKTGAEIAVAIVKTTGGVDIHDYSLGLFMDWGIGEKGRDNGVLILVAADDRNLWIKTGYGLEGAIPDADASMIYRQVLRPGFQSGQYDQALVTATKMLAELILAESGEALAFNDSVPGRYLLAPRRPSQAAPLARLLFLFLPIGFFMLFRLLAGRSSRRRGYGGFWIGGFGGSSGGFGGGFGGFGGGGAGGGGAGGGW